MLTNKLLVSAILCKNYNSESNSIENILTVVETNKDLEASFNLYLNIKHIGKTKYHIFTYLRNDNKFRHIDDFKVPEEDINKDDEMLDYKLVYTLADFDFPSRGQYEFIVFAIDDDEYQNLLNDVLKEDDYQDLLNRVLEEDEKQAVYEYLTKNEDNNVFDTIIFEVK